ncbi:MAG: UPF0104 family protein [Bacteroidetes bacterium]|nr:MAG: UPF0104 family protein [Bacteroidota bacterium]
MLIFCRKHKPLIVFILKVILLSFALYFLLNNIKYNDFNEILTKTRYSFLIIFMVFAILIFIISTLKTKYLLDSQNIIISYRSIFINNWIGQFFNNFTPAGVGGDAYKFVDFKNEAQNYSVLLSLIIYDKIVGVAVLFINAIIFSSSLPLIKYDSFNYIYIVAVLLTVLILIICFKKYFIEMGAFSKIPWQLFSNFKSILILTLYYEIIFCFVLFSYKVLLLSINVEIDLFIVLKVVPIVFIGEYVPLSINSIGIREGLNVYLFGLFNYAKNDILFITIIGRILNLIISLFGGLLFLIKKYNGRNTRVTL